MTICRTLLTVIVCMMLVGCGLTSGNGGDMGEKIGVYDSRSIAIAAIGSDYYAHHISPLEDDYRKAKADGDQERTRELEAKVWARRKQTHRQGFGRAPVDNILEYIRAEMPAIAKKAGVVAIVSKWDAEALSKYASARRVDVTMLLVDAFKPNAKQRQTAIDIQSKDPVPAEELEEHLNQNRD